MLTQIIEEYVLKFLRRPNVVRAQLLASIHGSFVFRAFKEGYRQVSDSVIEPSPMSTDPNKSTQRSTSSTEPEQQVDPGEDQEGVHELRMYSWFKVYRYVSTIYMLYAFIRTCFRAQLEGLIALFDPARANCYLAGVYVVPFHRPLSVSIGCIFALCHLVYRFTQLSRGRTLKLSMVFYLLQPDAAIQRQLQLFGQEHTETRYRDLLDKERLSKSDMLLHRLLYYSVRYKTQTVYKLRPNRSPESRWKICDNVAKTTAFCVLIYLLLFWFIFPVVVLECIRDLTYIKDYPGCSPDLEARKDSLTYWSVDLTQPHRLYAVLFEIFENWIIWNDSGAALYFNLKFAYELNYDVLLYWRHLNASLERLLNRLELNYYANQVETLKWIPVNDRQHHGRPNKGLTLSTPKFKIMQPNEILPMDLSESCSASGRRYQLFTETRDIEREIVEVQAEINDFFHQIGLVDAYISDVISASILIWLFSWGVVTYMALVQIVGEIPMFVRLYEVIGFILFTMATFFLLSLHRKTLSSYRCIVSLMALDQSEHKATFIRILEFYTSRRSAYTVFHRTPFLATTYLSIMGWSLSSLFIIENLFHKK